MKQCIIINETDGSTGGLVEGNTCIGPAASSSHLCILLVQDNIICRGNRVTAGQDGIHVSDGTTGITISGNLITGCVRDGIALGTTGAEVLNLYNNTIVGCDNGINQGSAAATGVGAVTNCLAIDCTTYGIYIGGAAVATTNNVYGNGTNYGGFVPSAGNLPRRPSAVMLRPIGYTLYCSVQSWSACEQLRRRRIMFGRAALVPRPPIPTEPPPTRSRTQHHQEILLDPRWADCQEHTLVLHGWTGLGGAAKGLYSQLYMRQCALAQIHQPTRDLVAVTRVTLETLQNLDENNPARYGLLNSLRQRVQHAGHA